jgi:DNA mismatch endonuclease (patch repair protein)
MSQIKGKNTKPEIMVRKFLFSNGFRYRLHVKKLPGEPDIVLAKYKTVIFVNGCFWHGHEGCKYFVVPKSRTDWWLKKIERNKLLDNKNTSEFKSKGWKVINIFECNLKPVKLNELLSRIVNQLDETSFDNER